QNFAADVDGDLAREVAVGHRDGDLGDVANLTGEVRRHRVDVVGQVLPGAGDAGDHRLAAQLGCGSGRASDARHCRGERAELIDHRVDGVLQLQNLATDVDGDLLGEIAVGNRDGHFRDVPDLRRQVAGHLVDVVGQVLPGAGDAGDHRLAA